MRHLTTGTDYASSPSPPQAGKLSLDDTLSKLVPDYPNGGVASKVTIRQLLMHTSGMSDFFNRQFQESSRARYRNLAAYRPLVVDEPLLFKPGAKWSYSNTGFFVLGW